MFKSKLGQIPCNKAELKKYYFESPSETWNAVKKHPGHQFYQYISDLKFSLEFFNDSIEDLFKVIEEFRTLSNKPEFWYRSSRDKFNLKEKAIRKAIFIATSSAMALVDLSRRVVKKMEIENYREKTKEIFLENIEHKFIQGLRNFVNHRYIIKPEWKKKYSFYGSTMKFILLQEELLSWENWSPQSLQFIKEHPEGIDIEKIFSNYQGKVNKFQEWFLNEIRRKAEPHISEYEKYIKILKGFEFYSHWKLILIEAIKRKIDPYEYLDRHFTEQELRAIKSLPHRSREQIDKMIKILDEYEVCDNEIRRLVYSLFGLEMY